MTPWIAAQQASLSVTNSVAQTDVHWVSDANQPSHPLSSPLLLPSIFPSIRVFSNESALCMRWPKYWSFSFNISPSNEHSGLISFRMDWFDFLSVQGTLKSLLQHHSSKASILQLLAFFMVQLIILVKKEISAYKFDCCCYSVGKLCLTLWYHGLQHTWLLCPPLLPGVCLN